MALLWNEKMNILCRFITWNTFFTQMKIRVRQVPDCDISCCSKHVHIQWKVAIEWKTNDILCRELRHRVKKHSIHCESTTANTNTCVFVKRISDHVRRIACDAQCYVVKWSRDATGTDETSPLDRRIHIHNTHINPNARQVVLRIERRINFIGIIGDFIRNLWLLSTIGKF